MATQAEYNKLAAEEPAVVDVPLTPRAVSPAPAPARGACFTNTCCFCFPAATGVKILGMLDLLHGVTALMSAAFILIAQANEGALDKALEGGAFSLLNMTASEAAEEIAVLNHGLDVLAARAVPFIIITAFIFFLFGRTGLKAAAGDLSSARLYWFWRVAGAFSAAFSGSLLGFALAIYFMVVARSHYVNVSEALALPISAPPTHEQAAPSGTIQ